MTTRNAQLNSFVRIDASNKVLRISDDGVDGDITLSEGDYYMGFGSTAGGLSDMIVTLNLNSLVTEISTQLPANWGVQVEFPEAGGLTSPTATGHVWVNAPNSSTDKIYWSHANTTVDLSWFGVHEDANTHTQASGGTWEDVSDFSSSLVYVSSVQVRRDAQRNVAVESALQAGSGKIYSGYYGRIDGLYLEFRITGLTRQELDVSYHAMRRFIAQQATRRALGFFYMPDTASMTSGHLLRPDHPNVTFRYGIARYCVSVGQPLGWIPEMQFESYQREWTYALNVSKYAA